MKFKKDIFISYAHIDDESLIVGEAGWISEFHRSLDVRLAQLLGYRPNIWRDKELDGNHIFSDEILQQLNEIAILVSVHSPRYVKSEWCLREVNEFYKIAENNIGAAIGNKSRIFKVIKTPFDFNLQPPVIQGLLGYEFFKTDPDTGKSKEFSSLFGKDAQLAYWSKLDDLAHDLAELLTDIQQQSSTNVTQATNVTTPSNTNNSSKRKVFLAETSSDCKTYRETISRLLTDEGFVVFPDKHLSVVADEYAQEIKTMVDECELSIHLLASNFGLVLEGTTKSKAQLQNEIAAEASAQRNLQRLIWLPPELALTDERQIKFVTDLKCSEALLKGADLLIAPLEDLKFALQDKLTEHNKEVELPDNDVDSDAPKQVYLICDQPDLDAIQPLENYLFDAGFNVIIPAFEGDQTALRLDHQENLKSCDAVLIYYGSGGDLWLRSKTRDLLKIAGYGRKAPLNTKMVCLAEPFTQQKERFRSHDMQVTSITNNDLTVLDEFIKEIKQ
jgi:TIR domain